MLGNVADYSNMNETHKMRIRHVGRTQTGERVIIGAQIKRQNDNENVGAHCEYPCNLIKLNYD